MHLKYPLNYQKCSMYRLKTQKCFLYKQTYTHFASHPAGSVLVRQVFSSAQTTPHPRSSLTSTVQVQGSQRGVGEERGGRRRVIIPFEGGAKGEAKKADEAFEAHIDMWLCRLLCAQVRTNELCGRLILSGACRFPPVAVW